jgi:hypothetical protein
MATLPPNPAKFAIDEPPSKAAPKYPYNDVKQTESGHMQEFDDTPGAERIRTYHKSGSFSEIGPDGTEVHKIVGDGYEIIAKNKKVYVTGFCSVTIEGDSALEVKGNCYQRIKGDFKQVVEGNYDLSVVGDTNITTGKDMDIGTVNPTDGEVTLLAGDSFVINSDLYVHGSITGDKVHSTGAVTAGTGIHAGVPGSLNPLAGISTLGSISAGVPAPPQIPGHVTATVLVTGPAVVGSVITYGSVLMDPLGGASLIRTFYDVHTHVVPHPTGGVTTSFTPVPQMPLP